MSEHISYISYISAPAPYKCIHSDPNCRLEEKPHNRLHSDSRRLSKSIRATPVETRPSLSHTYTQSSCYCSKKADIPWQLGRMIWNHHCNQSPKHEIPRHLFAKQISQNNSGFWKAHTCHAGVIWKSTCFSLPSSKCQNPSNRLQDLLIFRFSFCFIVGLCFSFPPYLCPGFNSKSFSCINIYMHGRPF